MSKKAIIIGASSGIGEAIARQLSNEGFTLGLSARRIEKLEKIKSELPSDAHLAEMDVTNFAVAEKKLQALIQEMGDVDWIIINAGMGLTNHQLDSQYELQTIDTNVSGFTVMMNAAFKYFKERGHGQIIGISSIAALLGNSGAPAYNASKAFVSNYMDGMRSKAHKENLDITITDIRPGFVATELTDGQKGMFWVASAEKAAEQIIDATKKKKTIAYITKRWSLIALFIKLIPAKLRFKFQ